jgi:hypothetical protein
VGTLLAGSLSVVWLVAVLLPRVPITPFWNTASPEAQ